MISPEDSPASQEHGSVDVPSNIRKDADEVLRDFQAGLDALPADLERAEALLAQAQEFQPKIAGLEKRLKEDSSLNDAQRKTLERELAANLGAQAALMEQALRLQGNSF